ncbi:MAG: demethylmenaquinone methyltransferase / 2-methoxy-6-polyprenyl,4-benzoquinol methylase [Bacteroidales bacterium]|jgi:demethylmenaquinone methyltransferase/2-methoxy-6-polyprenyl-1,4-benzoquinol methylase|nr:demethylmenaquinone methyltransferase / 2-methoxy-6-polyprenyl,4-benzoquinol methylase [Bacteroidales bacterium]MDN5329054.1 demethylmenaquinone methyltransferase / 2-methoxy-6-polyprenyl,4-benzoquinol methylase [Bacteroidales bacterium]
MDKGGRPQPIPFDEIAHRYDLLNRLLSFRIDQLWRKKLVRELPKGEAYHVLDVATGTADLALMAARRKGCRVTGCDVAEKMMDIGRKKATRKKLDQKVTLVSGAAENLPFAPNTFDAAMVAFGVRNFNDLEKGLAEMNRVLKPGGKILVLEFSIPQNRIFKALYLFYFLKVLPFLGGFISGNRKAYAYLPESVLKFPQGEEFLGLLQKAGFTGTQYKNLTMGIATLYQGIKSTK